jgi:hypothetical protein
MTEAYPPYANDADPWQAHLAEIDALLDRTNKILAGETPLRKSRSHLVYDPDQDEAEAEDLWLDVVKRTNGWPAIAAAAVAWNAWLDLNLHTRLPWLGLIMAAAILRARGLTAHLLPLAAGFKQSKFRPQGREGAAEKLEGFCQVLEEALSIAHKDLDRLILARELMGSVANLAIAQAMSTEASGSSRCGEQSSIEITLGLHVVRWCGPHLSLADHRHGLVTGDRLGCRHDALEAQPWPNQPLDPPVILLDDVIQELHLSELRKAPEFSTPLHGFDRDRVSGILVDRDGTWTDRMFLLQRFAEEPPCRSGISLG